MVALLGRLFSFITRGKDINARRQPSLLEQLPTELVLLICSHLSRPDTACLALSCHVLLLKIGRDSLAFPNSSEQDGKDRESLLTRISNDAALYYFCYICYKLHQWKNVRTPETAWVPLPCPMDRYSRGWRALVMNTNNRMATSYFFYFVHLQLAMRRYRHGPDYGISLHSLSHIEVLQPEDDGVTTMLSVEARACPTTPEENNEIERSLLLRVQQFAVIPSACTDIMYLDEWVDMQVCVHIFWKDGCKEFAHKYCDYSSETEKDPTADSPMYQCRLCHVDFQFQLRHVAIRAGQRVPALIITKWLDLGAGLDPNDPLWIAHKDPIPDFRLSHRDIGSVYSRFESEPGLSQQELTDQNRRLMSEEKFRGALRRLHRGMWIGRPGIA